MADLDKNSTAETLDVVNPYDQTYVGSVPTVTWDKIDEDLEHPVQPFLRLV